MIIDTTFAIDIFRGRQDAIEKSVELDARGENVLITPISVFELWYSLDAKDKNKEEKLAKFVETFDIIQFDVESAKRAGKILLELKEKGTPIDIGDIMICGIALKNNLPILTRDKGFAHVKNVKIETY